MLRENEKVVLIGLTQEQHPDRCVLFAQWQRLDWPILWDPFNLTDSEVVPLAIGIDEHGIVRKVGLSLRDLDEFLATSFPREEVPPELDEEVEPARPSKALSSLLTQNGPTAPDTFASAVAALEQEAQAEGAPPSATFCYGVALRMRYDSPQRKADDFQESLNAWNAALRRRPSQYIWRRRIQQWGPALDKPYPFYGWIEQANREVSERGETPHPIRVALTSSELSGRQVSESTSEAREHPDPQRAIPRAKADWVSIESAVAPNTSPPGQGEPETVQVHLVLRPALDRGLHWGNDAGPTEIWIEDADRWGLARPDFVLARPRNSELSQEARTLDFMASKTSSEGAQLRGTAFFFACGDKDDECRFLAQDFVVSLASQD